MDGRDQPSGAIRGTYFPYRFASRAVEALGPRDAAKPSSEIHVCPVARPTPVKKDM